MCENEKESGIWEELRNQIVLGKPIHTVQQKEMLAFPTTFIIGFMWTIKVV